MTSPEYPFSVVKENVISKGAKQSKRRKKEFDAPSLQVGIPKFWKTKDFFWCSPFLLYIL